MCGFRAYDSNYQTAGFSWEGEPEAHQLWLFLEDSSSRNAAPPCKTGPLPQCLHFGSPGFTAGVLPAELCRAAPSFCTARQRWRSAVSWGGRWRCVSLECGRDIKGKDLFTGPMRARGAGIFWPFLQVAEVKMQFHASRIPGGSAGWFPASGISVVIAGSTRTHHPVYKDAVKCAT